MLRTRLLTAAVAIPVLLGLILYPSVWPLAGFVFCVGAVGIVEYAGIVFSRESAERVLTVILGAGVLAAGLTGDLSWSSAALSLATAVTMVWVLLTRADFEFGLRDAGLILLGVLYLGGLLPHFAALKRLGPDGPYWIIFTIAIAMVGDASGYFVGHGLGRHKLAPHVSPGKTIEGAVGILIGSLVAGLACRWVLRLDASVLEVVMLSLVMGVLGQLGDLSESVIKRAFAVKESGWIFPGHGGVLDRVDSLLFPVAFLYYHLLWLHRSAVAPGGRMLTTVVSAVVVLGLLILFHELGHFLVAKRCGVGVLKFSIGFGPTLLGRKIGDTEYVLSAIPLGGFVKMVGEDPEEEVSAADRAIAFQTQSLGKRLAIVLAGPVANILFAFVAFTLVVAAYGDFVPSDSAKVGAVREGMPAAAGGLQAGDLVTAVDGQPVAKWVELSEQIRASKGRTLDLTVARGESTLHLTVTPREEKEKNVFNETVGTAYLIGIEPSFEARPVGLLAAVDLGARQTAWWVGTLATSVFKLIQGRIPAADIGGPILIAQAAGQQARMGLDYLLRFMAVISINLGVLNLLPIPVLDGGHLVFFLLEAIRRRPLESRHREIAQQVGLVLLLGLMAFAFYNDIARVIRNWG